MLRKAAVLSLLTCGFALSAAAQDGDIESIPFAGGELTISSAPEGDKILAFDGQQLARDYFVFFDRIDAVSGTDVAFVFVGSGGNACSPAVAMVWKPEGGGVRADIAGKDDCAVPAPAIASDAVYFVPWLLPGQTSEVKAWSPADGFRLQGRISYAPEPGTTWADLADAAIGHPLDFFRNADVYAAAEALLGDALEEVATGLGTAAAPEREADDVWTATGCVPHACGVSDAFLAVDAAGAALYFAKQDDGGTTFWPTRDKWPASISAALPSGF